MADGLSAPESVKAVYTIDTVVWGQVRFLPLHLDKHYINMSRMLKKLSAKEHSDITDNAIEEDDDIVVDDDDHNDDDRECDEDENNNPDECSKIIEHLKSEIKKMKDTCKENHMNVLPDCRTIRRNHHLLAVYVEKRIGDELVQHGGFCMPDGTTRNKVGEISAMILKVNGKMRAMKGQRIGKGGRSTWADVVVHMLQRLTVASNKEIAAIWEAIKTMLSNLCKVNRNLASQISKVIGSAWIPGQLFCVLHYVLAIPEAIKEVLTRYQTKIGTDKLFPETTGFEMNINDKTIVIQILDIWMRLTSIRWHGRMWNRYNSYTGFAEKNGIRNVGHMIHANRFAEFEERCAGGVYMADTWIAWLDTFTDVRNTLSCYLRSVITLMEICVFQWAAAALVGLHVTTPFMSMLLDYKATQRELLVILPNLYHELNNCDTSLIKFDGPAINALAKFWQPPFDKNSSPYGVDVMKSLQKYTDSCDHDLMNSCVKEITEVMAVALKRQHGNAYGFGDDPNSEDLVSKNMPDEMMDDPDATHTKPVENFFGNFDRYVSKTGPQGFDKITDDLVIKYGKDLIDHNEHAWRLKENKQASKKLKELQKVFDREQDALRSSGVSDSDISVITTSNKIQRVVKQCKTHHNGPLITKEELDEIVSTMEDTKELNKLLDLEIRYRKFTMTKVKSDCPLFLQKKLDTEQKIKNLKLLMHSQELGMKALATMSDLASVINLSTTVTDGNTDSDEIALDAEEITEDDTCLNSEPSIPSLRLTQQTVLAKDEFILGVFEDGFYPGQVLQDSGDTVEAIFMQEVVQSNYPSKSFWKWPSRSDRQTLKKVYVLEIRPNIDVVLELSTRRCLIYKLLNLELVEKFTEQ